MSMHEQVTSRTGDVTAGAKPFPEPNVRGTGEPKCPTVRAQAPSMASQGEWLGERRGRAYAGAFSAPQRRLRY